MEPEPPQDARSAVSDSASDVADDVPNVPVVQSHSQSGSELHKDASKAAAAPVAAMPVPDVSASSQAGGEPSSESAVAVSVSKTAPTAPAAKRQKRAPIEPDGGAGIVRLNRSPDEVLIGISPPGCRLHLRFADHRWQSSWQSSLTCEHWTGKFRNKTYSETFTAANWQEVLARVHRHAWEKWALAEDALPLEGATVRQVPGTISPVVYDVLSPIVAALPAKRQYNK